MSPESSHERDDATRFVAMGISAEVGKLRGRSLPHDIATGFSYRNSWIKVENATYSADVVWQGGLGRLSLQLPLDSLRLVFGEYLPVLAHSAKLVDLPMISHDAMPLVSRTKQKMSKFVRHHLP